MLKKLRFIAVDKNNLCCFCFIEFTYKSHNQNWLKTGRGLVPPPPNNVTNFRPRVVGRTDI